MFRVGIGLLVVQTEQNRRLGALGLSFVYGLAASAFGARGIFDCLLDQDFDADERIIFHVAHVIYGLPLGTSMNFKERTGRMYE